MQHSPSSPVRDPIAFLGETYSPDVVWIDSSPNSNLITKPYVTAVIGDWEVRDYADEYLRVWYTPGDVCIDAIARPVMDETWTPESLHLAANDWFVKTASNPAQRLP